MKFKKLITWMLIFLMLFNFLTGTISCKATDEEESKEANEEMEFIRGATDVLLKGVDWTYRCFNMDNKGQVASNSICSTTTY